MRESDEHARIQRRKGQIFVLLGLLVISDKFINRENAEVIRRELGMTKVGRMLFEDEMKERKDEGMKKMAGELLRRGDDVETIMKLTDLTEEEVKEVEKNMLVLQ